MFGVREWIPVSDSPVDAFPLYSFYCITRSKQTCQSLSYPRIEICAENKQKRFSFACNYTNSPWTNSLLICLDAQGCPALHFFYVCSCCYQTNTFLGNGDRFVRPKGFLGQDWRNAGQRFTWAFQMLGIKLVLNWFFKKKKQHTSLFIWQNSALFTTSSASINLQNIYSIFFSSYRHHCNLFWNKWQSETKKAT